MLKFLRKYHKWLSIIISLFVILFVISGIVLNHRQTFSFWDISRNLLPKDYRYENWNNASVKSTLKLSNDSILIYGNIGIWLTDSTFSKFTDFNKGFRNGIDNRKICAMTLTSKNRVLAGTFFGLFEYNHNKQKWIKVELPSEESRVVDLLNINDTTYVMTRSFLFRTTDFVRFEKVNIPPPVNYDNNIGLFKTFWAIHSGEIYGLPGKLIVDVAGLIFAFLTITGIILFINKYLIKKKDLEDEKKKEIVKSSLWHLKWHNKIGWITVALLLINTFTGMFLRPPFLITIANSRVSKIPFTELATPNPYFDILRQISFDEGNNVFLLATMDGIFYSDDNFQTHLKSFTNQPPVSVMGINVFKRITTNLYLLGSFEGLYLWNYATGEVYDYIRNEVAVKKTDNGRPIGEFMIAGFSDDFLNQEIAFDYNQGAGNLTSDIPFPEMPKEILQKSPMSMWNFALEVHTGRIFEPLIGGFYILVVPIVGIFVLFILISGLVVWFVQFRKKKS
jgi:hypothetical protein